MIKTYNSIEEISDYLIDQLEEMLDSHKGDFHLSLSGGRTPTAIFEHFRNHYSQFPYWQRIHFWWGDERLVPLSSDQSNGGKACRTLLEHLDISKDHIHLINHPEDPEGALIDLYNQLDILPKDKENRPYLHWTWLGLGEDGHCASLFPDFNEWHCLDNLLLRNHPETGQKRISFGPALLARSKKTSFLVTGESKRTVMQDIFSENERRSKYPAYIVSQSLKEQEWICDKEATPEI